MRIAFPSGKKWCQQSGLIWIWSREGVWSSACIMHSFYFLLFIDLHSRPLKPDLHRFHYITHIHTCIPTYMNITIIVVVDFKSKHIHTYTCTCADKTIWVYSVLTVLHTFLLLLHSWQFKAITVRIVFTMALCDVTGLIQSHTYNYIYWLLVFCQFSNNLLQYSFYEH